MRDNVLRTYLLEGRGSLGTHLASTWPSLIELLGYSGFSKSF